MSRDGPCVCVYTIRVVAMKKKNRKSGQRSVSPPGFSFVLLGDHLSAGHLVRQIEMWLPFFFKRNLPSDIGRHLDPYIYLVSRLCLDSCPRIGPAIFVKNSVRDKRAVRFSKFMERNCSILLSQTSGDQSVSCVRPISPNF